MWVASRNVLGTSPDLIAIVVIHICMTISAAGAVTGLPVLVLFWMTLKNSSQNRIFVLVS